MFSACSGQKIILYLMFSGICITKKATHKFDGQHACTQGNGNILVPFFKLTLSDIHTPCIDFVYLKHMKKQNQIYIANIYFRDIVHTSHIRYIYCLNINFVKIVVKCYTLKNKQLI